MREAAAAKGTFYVYFPTWEDLLEVLRDRTIKAFDAAYPVPAGTCTDLDWLRLVERLAVAFVDGVVAMGGLHTVLFHTDFAQRRPLPDDDSPIGRLIAIVRAGGAAGAFADVDAGAVGRLLFAVIHETADAVVAGADRRRALAAMRRVLRKTLEPDIR